MRRVVNKINFPNPLIVFDNYCENYEELEKLFPKKSELKSTRIYHHETSLTEFPDDYVFKLKEWDNLIKYHTSKEYFQVTCNLFEKTLIKWRPKLWNKIKSENYTYGASSDKFDVYYDVVFITDSEYKNMNGMSVHVDNQLKIFQTMIYFKNPKDYSTGGNLHLCNVKKDNKLYDIVKCKYSHNRTVILPHTPSGWHFVTPTNSQYDRKMINIIFSIREELQEIDSKFFEQKV